MQRIQQRSIFSSYEENVACCLKSCAWKKTETVDEVQRDERQIPLRILTLLHYAFVTQNDLFFNGTRVANKLIFSYICL